MPRTTLGFTRARPLLLALLLAAAGQWAGAAWMPEARAQQAAQQPGAQQPGAQQQGAQQATPFQPVAVVNGSAITGYDLSQRAQIMAALGFPTDNTAALRNEALDRLIEDRLKMQEAERLGLEASPEQIQAGIEEMAQNAGAPPDEMLAMLSAQGVGRQAIEDMVAADVVWRQVVRTRFSRRVEPGEAEIDAEIEQFQSRAGQAFRIAEIGLPLEEEGRTAAETRALADRLSSELSLGRDFGEAVRRHSRAPSAANGGEVGWVTAGALPPRIAETLARLEPGDVSEPIEVSGGFTILKVLETRVTEPEALDAADPELRERVRSRLASQQGGRLAEGLLQELRRDALIEVR